MRGTWTTCIDGGHPSILVARRGLRPRAFAGRWGRARSRLATLAGLGHLDRQPQAESTHSPWTRPRRPPWPDSPGASAPPSPNGFMQSVRDPDYLGPRAVVRGPRHRMPNPPPWWAGHNPPPGLHARSCAAISRMRTGRTLIRHRLFRRAAKAADTGSPMPKASPGFRGGMVWPHLPGRGSFRSAGQYRDDVPNAYARLDREGVSGLPPQPSTNSCLSP